MKKLQIITITALMASGVAYAALDWDGVDNLAKGASVTLSSNDSEGNRAAIVDDNNGSGWQAAGGAVNPDWALIDLGESKAFKDIEIKWEASHPNTYKVYVTDNAPTVTASGDENVIDAAWLTANDSKAVERDITGEASVDDHITGDFSGRYLLIYDLTDNNWASQYGMRIFEVRVGDFSALADRISKLALEDVSVVRGETATVNVKAMTATGEGDLSKVTNLRLEASDPSVTVTDKGNGQFEVVPSAYGSYTLTASGTADGKDLTATAKLTSNPDASTYLINESMTFQADAKNANGEDNAKNAFDGNMTTGWMAGRDGYGIEEGFEPAGANEHWLKVNFWRPFNLYMVSLNWEGANCNDYEVYVLDTDEVPESFDGLTPALTYYENPRQAARTDNLFGDLENVKTLLFRFRNNATGYGLNLFEVNFYGSPSEESVAKDITLETNVGEAVKINETGAALLVSAVDQYDDVMTVPVSVEGTGISYDVLTGALTAEAEGSVEITAGEGDVAKTITVGSFDGSTQANIALVASATVDNGDNAAVVLNKSESTGLEDMYQPKNQNMAPYKLTIDLGKEYPADVIEVIWETAHASDFEILTGTDPNALTSAYAVAGRSLRGYDNVIDRTMLEKNTPVRYIQIDVTGHAHEYPSAIRRVRLYNADSAEMLGITDITVEPAKARTIYNLQGIAVPADRMERGTIYIVDGVKMIIK